MPFARSRIAAALVAGLVVCVAGALGAPYRFMLVPSDALVRRERGRSEIEMTLVVRREPGVPAYAGPAALVIRATSGDTTTEVRLARATAPADDGTYQELVYRGDLPPGLSGPTLLAASPPGGGPELRAMVSVISAPSYDAIARAAPVTAAAGIEPVAAPVEQNQLNRFQMVANQAAGDATRAGLRDNEPVYFAFNTRALHTIHRLDARFQLSFLFRFSSDPAKWQAPVFTLTTTSLWDLHSYSFPFRDSTYRPGLMWAVLPRSWPGIEGTTLGGAFGVEHESNGRGPDPDSPRSPANNDDLSRSMNRFYFTPKVTWKNERFGSFTFAPKLFVPFFVADNNPDISHYRGRADLLVTWRSRESHGQMVSVLARQGTEWGRHFVQIDYGVPCFSQSWLLFQWLYGYGETLRDYKVRNPGTLRIGWMVKPWAANR